MAAQEFTPIFGVALRAVRVDSCGVAVSGATGQFVTAGFIKVERKPQYETGSEFIVKNAHGDLCVNRKSPDKLKRIDLSVTICSVDPEGMELLTGARLLKSGADSTGNAYSEGENLALYSLEVWQEVAVDACEVAGGAQYVHHLFPLVENASLSDTVIEEGPAQWVINANTRKTSAFSDPFGEWTLDEAVEPGDHHLYKRTTVVPPTPDVGYQPLTLV